jgi:hypothetical protein
MEEYCIDTIYCIELHHNKWKFLYFCCWIMLAIIL